MLKARKGNLIVLGLSDENLKRLKDDQPIKFPLKDVLGDMPPGDCEIMIFNGKDEKTMAGMLEKVGKPKQQYDS